jgi:hypothetical protein
MKSLILLCALLMPACSHFTESGRIDRAYAKHMKQLNQARLAHEQRRAHSFREAAKLPPPPPESPLTVSVSSGDQ